ncbi:MAG: amidohydrolase family protein, partial [Oscillospiraceae bacterium]|nr:amidohydrolase family protein [Oscillospiraceae bacterium]
EKELQRMKSLGLRGVKIHTDFQRFYIDDERAFGMYRAIADTGLPILFHMGDDKRPFSEPSQLRRVKERVPELVAIAAHFGGYSCWENVPEQLGGIQDLYFDTSSSLAFIGPQTAASLIEKLGEDRFFFGTDFPMWDHVEELERFMNIPLTETAREKILWGNFERLFML